MIDHIATISTNNDPELGKLIADAFRSVNLTGVVMMEPSAIGKTEIKLVEGAQYEKGLTNSGSIIPLSIIFTIFPVTTSIPSPSAPDICRAPAR